MEDHSAFHNQVVGVPVTLSVQAQNTPAEE